MRAAMFMSRVLLGVCIWMCLGAVALAAPDDRALARSHFRQGEAYQAAGAYDQALAEYQTAYRLTPLPALLFNMGQASRLLGNKEAALDFYRRYLDAAPTGPGSDEARDHVAQLVVELREDKLRLPMPEVTTPAPAPPEPTPPVVAPTPAPIISTPDVAPAVVLAAPPRPTPIYRRWWLWTAVGGVAVAVALGVGLGVGLDHVHYPSAATSDGSVHF